MQFHTSNRHRTHTNQLIRAILELTTHEASGKRSNHRNATLPSQIPHKRGRNANFDENLIFFDRRFFDDSTRGREIAAAGRDAVSSEHRWDSAVDHKARQGFGTEIGRAPENCLYLRACADAAAGPVVWRATVDAAADVVIDTSRDGGAGGNECTARAS